jgi:hypothetical protein
MLLNGAAGPDDGLWGLNAPSGFGMPEWRAAAAWGRVRERAMGGWKRRFLAKTQSAQRIGFVSRERGGLGGFASLRAAPPLWLADYQKLRLSLLPDFLINYPLTFGVEAERECDGYGQDNR